MALARAVLHSPLLFGVAVLLAAAVPAARAASVVEVSCGQEHALALLDNGTALAFGANYDTQLDAGRSLDGVRHVAAGANHSMVLFSTGKVHVWGYNFDGQTMIPAAVQSGIVKIIATGYGHNLAVTTDGNLHCWGWQSNGQCTFNTTGSDFPRWAYNVQDVAGGSQFTVVRMPENKVKAWGLLPAPVPDKIIAKPDVLNGDVVAIAAGYTHSLAWLNDGSIVSWGDPKVTDLNVPADLAVPNSKVISIGARATSSWAVLKDGTLRVWGALSNVPPGKYTGMCVSGLGWALGITAEGKLMPWGDPNAKVPQRIPRELDARYVAPTPTPTVVDGDSGGPPIGAIVGGVVGGLVTLLVAAGLAYYLARRNRTKSSAAAEPGVDYPISNGDGKPEVATPVSAASDATAYETMAMNTLVKPPSKAPVSNGPPSNGPSTLAVPTAGSNASNNTPKSPMSPRLRIDPKDLNIDYGAKLGDGGFGEVFAGKLFITTPVAVKIMRARVDDATLRAFEREVTTWESMIHPNVMPLMAYTVSPPMLISPLAVQGNLRKYLAALNWPQPDGIRLLHGVALGMSFLHARGVLHGDLKSLNVLVDAGVARITDFGLARFASWATTSDAGLRGTPAFMSPESFDNDPPRPPADVYAFGMVCYEVVSRGRHPFEEAGSLPVLMRMVLEGQRPARPAGVPDRLWRLMQRCWVEKPEDRPSFVEIVGELGTIIGV